MKSFSARVFWTAFGIGLSASVTVSITFIATQALLTPFNALLATAISLAASSVLAALLACYRYSARWCQWIYRTVLRRLAKRAVRSSLSNAMTHIECLGIMEKDGGVSLRIGSGELDNVTVGMPFNVYDSVNGELWGRVEAVEVSQETSLCVPTDVISEIINKEFWEHLESRMRYDTSAPNVYLTLELPADLLEIVESILEDWR